MTNDMDEWFPGGVILYTDSHNIPRIRIVTKNHTYEMQSCKFDPVMNVFSLFVDGEFRASRYDSLDRLLKLDEASRSGKCSARELELSLKITSLENQIKFLNKKIDELKICCDDMKLLQTGE